MTINFENYGKFDISFFYDDNTTDLYDGNGKGYTLKEAADFISTNIENSLSIVSADIIDTETGEIVATVTREDEDIEEDYYEPDYDECGFNPYMGCYDYDC